MEAEKKGIKVSVNISKSIENSFLGNLETINFKQLTRIIGVYLDNAIEASYTSDDKKLGIEVYLIRSNIDIIISNTFNNNIDTNKIGRTKFSTKGRNHGHGLLLAKSILNNSKIFEGKSEIKNMGCRLLVTFHPQPGKYKISGKHLKFLDFPRLFPC